MSTASQSLQLLRIEHKLDLVLHALQEQGLMLSDLPSLHSYHLDLCPVCQTNILISADLATETYTRACGCRPPFPIVPGISQVLAPTPTSEGNSDGSESTEAPGEG